MITSHEELQASPLHEDGITHIPPVWSWFVVVRESLYVRAFGTRSRWYRAAEQQKVGKIILAREVAFTIVRGQQNEHIDEAYREKYRASHYLSLMLNDRTREATLKITPAIGATNIITSSHAF